MFQGTHVMQPIGQLDQHHAHVGDHGQQHLAHILGLTVLAIGKLDFVDFGDALDDVSHLVAEAGFNLFAGGGRVFYRIVQQARGDGCRVHLHLRQHLGDFKGMNDVRLAGGAHLSLMMLRAEFPCLADQAYIFSGAVDLDVAEKRLETLVDGLPIRRHLAR